MNYRVAKKSPVHWPVASKQTICNVRPQQPLLATKVEEVTCKICIGILKRRKFL